MGVAADMIKRRGFVAAVMGSQAPMVIECVSSKNINGYKKKSFARTIIIKNRENMIRYVGWRVQFSEILTCTKLLKDLW